MKRCRSVSIVILVLTVFAWPAVSEDVADEAEPVRVYILLGQSNMVGFGAVGDADKPGTLANLAATRGLYTHWLDDEGGLVERDDVWCVKTTVGQRQGWLSPTFGARGNLFGPELGFGEVVGDTYGGPVLLIKASQGNRSLGWDILPPGSERFVHDGRTYAGYGDDCPSWIEGQEKKPVNWYAGKQYDDFVRDAKEVLANPERFYPDYDGRGLEVAGFVWWQGHKDQNAAHASRYEQNLVRLIKTLREGFDAPEAKFVLATIGFNGEAIAGHGLAIVNAQLAVDGGAGNYPEFEGSVAAVDARPLWRERGVSPSGQGHHYHHNAETYMEVGLALGRAMVRLEQQEQERVRIGDTGAWAEVSERLPRTIDANAAPSLTANKDRLPWRIDSGTGMNIQAFGRGRRAPYRAVWVEQGQRLVRVEVGREQSMSVYGQARVAAASLGRITLVGSDDERFDAIGYVLFRGDGNLDIDLRDRAAAGGVRAGDLPVLSEGDKLYLYFSVPVGKTLVAYALGRDQIDFDSELTVSER